MKLKFQHLHYLKKIIQYPGQSFPCLVKISAIHSRIFRVMSGNVVIIFEQNVFIIFICLDLNKAAADITVIHTGSW